MSALDKAIAFDRWVNGVIGGSPTETLSSRAHRAHARRRYPGALLRHAINALFFWQDDHCRQSYEWELKRGNVSGLESAA